ncbi:Hypothetical_protein [Hexamita inflata]|uniref:Hypothetical_protein n=1 Tax=Hexamita inflata TaxID=28002 RepID=A0AA86QRY3_9EUKA|nr:Hypothetical protein HINF_LOCUS48041 [Hexamita inflata]
MWKLLDERTFKQKRPYSGVFNQNILPQIQRRNYEQQSIAMIQQSQKMFQQQQLPSIKNQTQLTLSIVEEVQDKQLQTLISQIQIATDDIFDIVSLQKLYDDNDDVNVCFNDLLKQYKQLGIPLDNLRAVIFANNRINTLNCYSIRSQVLIGIPNLAKYNYAVNTYKQLLKSLMEVCESWNKKQVREILLTTCKEIQSKLQVKRTLQDVKNYYFELEKQMKAVEQLQ